MSTASFVPSTVDLDLDDVRPTLQSVSVKSLMRDSFLRFRKADGFSFARSLAFQVTFALIPTVILIVAVSARVGDAGLQSAIREIITSVAPGPASDMLLQAFEQGSESGGSTAAIVVGGSAGLIAAVTAMAQLQRGATRIYGIDTDRSTLRRYAVATALTLTVGIMISAAFLAIVVGGNVSEIFSNQVAGVWSWARWVGGILLLTASLALLFKVVPNRRQPAVTWLAMGGATAGIAWLIVTIGLAVYLNASSSFGETYGPLAGFMGLMLWSQLSSIGVLFGLAVAAQLEASRAGVPSPVAETDRSVTELSWA